MSKKIFPEERLNLIYNKIKDSKNVYVDELSKELSMSKSTIRADLTELEARGLITRTHGGAILKNETVNEDKEELIKNNVEINTRIKENQAEKKAIGKLTASMISDGDNIMIDGGSTTQFVAKYLANKSNLTIVTNSFYMLPTLLEIKNSAVYLAGGLVYSKNGILTGDLTNEFVGHFSPEKLILGIDGISAEHGLTVADSMVPAVASIKRKMIAQCNTLIIVCDHTKLGRACLMPISSLKRIDYLITDDGASKAMIKSMKTFCSNVMVANVEK